MFDRDLNTPLQFVSFRESMQKPFIVGIKTDLSSYLSSFSQNLFPLKEKLAPDFFAAAL